VSPGTTVIINYGLGNLGSVLNMLRRIGVPAVVSGDEGVLAAAERVVLPGVGAFDHGMARMRDSGLLPVLETLRERQVPILGICLGMQLMTRGSEEGTSAGLGWVPAFTRRLQAGAGGRMRLPHMGWSETSVAGDCPLFRDLPQGSRFYFVHAYHVVPDDSAVVVARADYGGPFVAAYAQDNLMGVQFHPERSHRFGMQLMRNFAALRRAP